MSEGKLIIFLKNPELGQVKTRLAQQIGDDAALAVYFKLIHRVRQVTDEVKFDKAVYYSRFVDKEDYWDNRRYTKYLQKGKNVGDRMSQAIKEVLEEGYSKAVLIGTDILDLRPDILENAFSLLDSNDVVIGPAKDGGYYLIGMKEAHPELFDLEYWSTPNVFSETVKRIHAAKLTFAKTDLLQDIDEVADLKGTDLYDAD